MNKPISLARRLDLLEQYLEQDPANAQLLADACDAAMEAGQHDRAMLHVARAEKLGLAPREWTFRRARVCIAQKDLIQAHALLRGLLIDAGEDPVVLHDLAYVRFLQGDNVGCQEVLAPWLERVVPDDVRGPIQQLWLRAAHREGLLDQAWAWARERHARRELSASAAGVASLIAIDVNRFHDARVLAQAALAEDPQHMEALVAAATVALAQRQTTQAVDLLRRALERNGEDGRAWSAMGFASMLQLDLTTASLQFKRALAAMPEHIGTWHGLGWCCLQQGDGEAAIKAFRHALTLDHNFAESHGALGVALVMGGHIHEADIALRRAQKLDASSIAWQYGRAVLAGDAADPRQLNALAFRLLDRPGPFGDRLNEWVAPKN